MTARIIDGKAIAAELRGRVAAEVISVKREHNLVPGLAVVLVGNDPASEVYVRGKRKQAFQEAHGFSLTYLPFIARATCLAIQAFPQVNARFDGKSLSLSPTVSLGVAVDLSHNGLVVPVVRNAEDLTVAGLAKAMRRLIDKARSGKLGPDDLSGGTYSISKIGRAHV